MGTQLHSPEKGSTVPPIFGACLLWSNGWMDQDATWYHGGRPRPRPYYAKWGPSSPPQKGGTVPQFSAHIYCGQTAGWIKLPLGTEVGLGPDHIVLSGDPAPLPRKGSTVPIFGACLLWPNGWMDQNATWYHGGRPRPGHIMLDRDSAPLPKMGTVPNFRPIYVVAKRLDGSRYHLVRR